METGGPPITREEFDAWRDHPVTRFVMAAVMRAAVEQQAEWMDVTWTQGRFASERLQVELMTRADAYRALVETDYEGWCEWMGTENV